MLVHETQVRVKYADTDQMGFVYHGRYLEYMEVGRTEMIRNIGISYTTVEANGIFMPVVDVHIKYKQPARYDDLLTIRTRVPELPRATFPLEYEILNEKGILILTASLKLAFLDQKRLRPTRVPAFVIKAIEAHWPS